MRRLIPHVVERLRLRLWIVPVGFAILAALGALIAVALEDRSDTLPVGLGVDSVSARALLGAISSAMISFTALVFSVTMLVLQLASSQLSPRVMRTFLRDRFNQVVLGLFVATFVFALLLLVSIGPEYVPQLGVFVAIILVLTSVLAFVAYIDHMAHAVGPSDVIDAIAKETRASLDGLYPESGAEPHERDEGRPDGLPEVVQELASPHRSGYVVVVDEKRLLKAAADGGHIIEVLAGPGSFVVHGEPLLAVRGGSPGAHLDDAPKAFTLSKERTMNQDPGFGFRQLIDIALKAMSPSMNDQTTANRVIDQLHDLLRMMRDRPLPSPRRVETEGALRVLVPGVDWEGYIRSTVAEVSESSRDLPFVTEHLRRMLHALADGAGPARIAAIRRALAVLDESPERSEPRHSVLS